MSRKLRLVCPLCMVLLMVLVFCAFSMNTKAASTSGQDVKKDVSVTFNTGSWSSDEADASATPAPSAVSAPAQPKSEDSTYITSASHSSGYDLTDEERIAVECAVMCEAGGESERGQMMVAQCILDGSLRNSFTVEETISYYSIMSTSYSNVTDQVKSSVSKVFDDGLRVTKAKADLWYNPAITPSKWHEEQQYVTTIGSHRFFWMNEDA